LQWRGALWTTPAIADTTVTSPSQTSYDEVPYTSLAFEQTHPDRLAVIAMLFGLAAPAVESCRVLELGAASGGNLIPMALQLPDAEFVGIDLSARQVGEGQRTLERLGLRNVALRQGDILELGADLGRFDYIVAHGVYSWVPHAVRERILELLDELLTEHGIGYVSYNTYPGWHMRGMIRDVMQYHASGFELPEQRVGQARALLEFLVKHAPAGNDAYGAILRQEASYVGQRPDYYVLHEYLEVVNEPLYFHQFIERARAHGLEYLGEAEFFTMLLLHFPSEAASALAKLTTDQVRLEQYMDFVRNRLFRQTLLVRAGHAIDRSITWRRLRTLRIAANPQRVSAPTSLPPGARAQYQFANFLVVNAMTEVMCHALEVLREDWPLSVPFEDLLSRALSRAGTAVSIPTASERESAAESIGKLLIELYARSLIQLRTAAPRFVCLPSERPVASPYARLLAEGGQQVTNMLHQHVNLDPAQASVLRAIDGTRTRADLRAHLAAFVKEQRVEIKRGGQVIPPDALEGQMDAWLGEMLGIFGTNALLIA
jgi:methyltransferase-like protein